MEEPIQIRAAGGDAVALVLAARATVEERGRALAPRRALERLARVCPLHAPSAVALDLLARAGVALGGRLWDDRAALRARVEAALGDGTMLLIQRTAPAPAPAAVPQKPADEPAPASADARPTKTWITVRLLDDADPPRPVANARYRITLPDDTVREGRLDAHGVAHFEGLDPGMCEVTFPDFDSRT
jgi:hypothetical protein